MTTHPSWPLDSVEHLRDALLEQGMGEDEAVDALPALLRMGAWQAPSPSPDEVSRMLAILAPKVPVAAKRRAPSVLWPLLWRQARLVHRGLWLASALCVACITLFAAIAPFGRGISALAFGLPIIAASGIAFVYGSESDPALELARATAFSPRAILLGRVGMVFSFDLALGLGATALVAALHGQSVWAATAFWLGPAALLSSGSLLLSLLVNPFVAAGSAAAIALGQAVRLSETLHVTLATDALWQTTPTLLALAVVLLLLAVLYVPRHERFA